MGEVICDKISGWNEMGKANGGNKIGGKLMGEGNRWNKWVGI